MNTVIFITAGGKGNRLRSHLPLESGLPKGLAVVIKNRPMIAYQLDILVKLRFPIAIVFSNGKSIEKFKNFIADGKVPNNDYMIMTVPYSQDSQIIDILKSTNKLKYFNQFDSVYLTCEESYYDGEHLVNLLNAHNEGFNVVTVDEFKDHMLNMKSHPLIVKDNNSNIKLVQDVKSTPREVSFVPMILNKKAFEIYISLPFCTYRSTFIRAALREGEKFKALKPKFHVHMDYIEDYYALCTRLQFNELPCITA